MRIALLVCSLALLLAGCTTPGATIAPQAAPHSSSMQLQNVELGRVVANVAVGVGIETAGFEVQVSAGGATHVRWSFTTTGTTAMGNVEGPGCTGNDLMSQTHWGNKVTAEGPCGDLKAGTYHFKGTNTGTSLMGFTVVITGDVPAA